MADPSETTQISRDPAAPETEELLVAVRALATQVGSLQAELQSVRARAQGLPAEGTGRPGWDEDAPGVRDTGAWVRSVDTPLPRRPAVPWLLLEILFLAAVAVLAAVARLDAPVVAIVMAGAWLLVALAEWMASQAARHERALRYGSVPSEPLLVDDPSWLDPIVEETAFDVGAAGEGAVTRLPPPQPE